jgi:uncharacterized membrane protein
MVLYKNFRATTFFNAFLLNAVIVTISSLCGYFLHHYVTKHHSTLSEVNVILITVVGTFIIAMFVQLVMFYLFAFGGGLLTRKTPRKQYHLFK